MSESCVQSDALGHPRAHEQQGGPAGPPDLEGAHEREVHREQRHLDRALARVEQLRAEVVARERQGLRAGGVGTPQARYERDVVLLADAVRRAELDGAGEGLIFGRLDRGDGEVLHVGRLGVRTPAQEPLVVDWRAPAAAAFYAATAAVPQGVVRRRTITCRRDRVVGVEDELLDPDAAPEGEVVVGEGALLAALSRERTGRMRDIVATIQAEQDAAVRAPDDGALLVGGGPGTGKTAVALHRVAYLMYARREFYARRGVLVVGPSPVFVDYISRVLPSLGETSVRLASLGDLPEFTRGFGDLPVDPPAAAAVKGSARMVEVLRGAIRELGAPAPGAPGPLRVRLGRQEVVVPASACARLRARVARRRRPYNTGRTAYAAALADAVLSTAQREGLTDWTHDDVVEVLVDDPAYAAALEAAWPVLLPAQVLDALRSGRVSLARVAGQLRGPEREVLATAWATGATTVADVALLDELTELLGEPPEPVTSDEDDPLAELAAYGEEVGYGEVTTFADRTARVARRVGAEEGYRSFAHVVVDEAQDVSPMQWRMIGRRARGATWTVVGDEAQSAWPDLAELRAARAAALGRAQVREVTLGTNYRTSTEIAELAARVLAVTDPATAPAAAVRRTGVDPDWQVVADVVAAAPVAVQALADAVTGTIAVIAPRGLVGALSRADSRVVVRDGWSAKGLEYDGVCVVDPAGLVAEAVTGTAGLRSLYVALTRATQRLVVVADRPLEQVLDDGASPVAPWAAGPGR